MPIIDTQKRLAQAGRIRAGEVVVSQSGRTRPGKLSHWRLTSSRRNNLEEVARMYGGRVQAWADAPNEGQYELYTEATELAVVVLPENIGFSQWMELWDAKGCIRRCDGAQMSDDTGGGPCQCDPDYPDCRPTTRLSVLLRGLPGVGLWRVDTHGRYAQAELAGAYDIAGLLTNLRGANVTVLPGTLRLEQRSVKRPDPGDEARSITYRFAVPVLDFNLDVAALVESDGIRPQLHPAGEGLTEQLEDAGMATEPVTLRPVPEPQTHLSPREQMQQVDLNDAPDKRKGSAPALPSSGAHVRTAEEMVADAFPGATEEPVGPHVEEPAGGHMVGQMEPDQPELIGEPSRPQQIRAIQTLFGKSGMVPAGTDRERRAWKLQYCANVINRRKDEPKLTSSKDLTLHEASLVIDALQFVVEGGEL